MREQELTAPFFGNEYTGSTGAAYSALPCVPEADLETPVLAGGESYEWAAIENLDTFFTRIYRYWHDKGLTTIVVAGLLNILALAFTVGFSGFLLLFVNWQALHAECIVKGTCDIATAVVYRQPLGQRSAFANLLVLTYLGIFSAYWVWTLVHFVTDLRDVVELRHFVSNKLGISERQVSMMTWAEVLHRIVLVQRTTRLCIARDLNEHDVVSRIMRKDNYLIGMLNRGVLKLHVPLKGLQRRSMLTKTLEWNLRWCVLDHMFDERFEVRPAFLDQPEMLRRRLQWMALANLLLAPFLFAFILLYFFMKNAEKFYHHPGSLGSRRWSSLAKWRMRELNELPHYINHRLAASHEAATKYVSQFPSHTVAHVARFVAFVTGSFTALLLLVTMLDETLLERPLMGRHIVWWLATLGVVLAASRTFMSEDPVAYDPENAMLEVAALTHYLPRNWRGRAHSGEVQAQFQAMFQLKLLQFLEETASILLTPFVLYFSLPDCTGDILQFVRDFTVRVEGVGDVCSLAAFDLPRHGNSKYGAPAHSSKETRSRQGKLEKSFLTFVATYPTWEPHAAGKRMLTTLCRHSSSHLGAPPAPFASAAAAATTSAYGPLSPAFGGWPAPAAAAFPGWQAQHGGGHGGAPFSGRFSPTISQQHQQHQQYHEHATAAAAGDGGGGSGGGGFGAAGWDAHAGEMEQHQHGSSARSSVSLGNHQHSQQQQQQQQPQASSSGMVTWGQQQPQQQHPSTALGLRQQQQQQQCSSNGADGGSGSSGGGDGGAALVAEPSLRHHQHPLGTADPGPCPASPQALDALAAPAAGAAHAWRHDLVSGAGGGGGAGGGSWQHASFVRAGDDTDSLMDCTTILLPIDGCGPLDDDSDVGDALFASGSCFDLPPPTSRLPRAPTQQQPHHHHLPEVPGHDRHFHLDPGYQAHGAAGGTSRPPRPPAPSAGGAFHPPPLPFGASAAEDFAASPSGRHSPPSHGGGSGGGGGRTHLVGYDDEGGGGGGGRGGVGDDSLDRSRVFGYEAGGGSDVLPTNEEAALGRRIANGHCVLQSFYQERDVTVQHRMQNQVHLRMSVMLQRGTGGGGGSGSGGGGGGAHPSSAAPPHYPHRLGSGSGSFGGGGGLVDGMV